LLVMSLAVILPPTIGKEEISIAFVRSSVRPSVAYIANNSRTQRPSVSNLEGRFSTLDVTCTPVSRSSGQRSGYRWAGAYRTGFVWLVCRSGIPCRTACGIRLLAGTVSDNLRRRFCSQRTDAFTALEVSRRCAI